MRIVKSRYGFVEVAICALALFLLAIPSAEASAPAVSPTAITSELVCDGDQIISIYSYVDPGNADDYVSSSESVDGVLDSKLIPGSSNDFDTEVIADSETERTILAESQDLTAIIELAKISSGWRPHLINQCESSGSMKAGSLRSTATVMMPAPWPSNFQDAYYIDNNTPEAMRGAIHFGLAQFSDLDGGQGPRFYAGGQTTTSNDFTRPSCSQPNLIFSNANIDGGFNTGVTGTLALTQVCVSGGVMKTFETTFEKFPTGGNYGGSTGWFTGSTSPGPNQYDLLSVATHEAGHAVGFIRPDTGGHLTSASDCPATFNQRATMCSGLNQGSIWKRSLESPDFREVNAAY